MRVLLPIRALLGEILAQVQFPSTLRLKTSSIQATVHEENASALKLATEQIITSRTRHYHVRWHFFWEAVQTGNVIVVYVETKKQDADFLTKIVSFANFETNRKRVLGW